MEKVLYPESLIYPDGKISIYYEDKMPFNNTKKAIIISGNSKGFLSLSNMINVYSVYLFNEIVITDFTFVSSKIEFKIIDDSYTALPNGYVIMNSKKHFEWKISEINLCSIICSIHSLGYANNELHFDTDLSSDDISVYCVVE